MRLRTVWLVVLVLGLASIAGATPVALFTATPNPASPSDAISFDASTSTDTDPTRAIISYSWAFGDGFTGSGIAPSHTYGLFGTFTVTLTITNNGVPPESDSKTHIVNVNQGNHAPTANAGGPYAGLLGDGLALDGSGSTDPDIVYGDYLVSFLWDLDNDGLFGDVTGISPLLTGPQVASYFTLGLNPISLRVVDSFGLQDDDTTLLTLTEPAASSVPEPASLMLLGTGLVSVAARVRRKRR
jgi:PKD repeat protein